jgi:nitrilase
MPIVTVAIVQHPAAILDLPTSLERAAHHVTDAAARGAGLVVFPETWLTTYPAWVFGLAGWRDETARHWHALALEHSVVLDHTGGLGDGLAPVREAARDAGVTVAIGINERAAVASGSAYNSLVVLGPDGSTLNLHRKLMPTHTERIAWAAGDAAGLRVVDTPVGRVGGLICWEHFHPLARHALHVQQEEIHVAVWPDVPESHCIASRSYALEGRCHVISAAQIVSVDDLPDELRAAYRAGVGPDAPSEGLLFNGGSHVVAPDGSWVLEPVYDRVDTLLATFDTDARYGELLDLDVAGHYTRPDVFRLEVDTRRYDSGVRFTAERALNDAYVTERAQPPPF